MLEMRRVSVLVASLAALGGCSDATVTTPTDVEPTVEARPPLPEIIGARLPDDINPADDVLELDLFAHFHQTEIEPGTPTWTMSYNGGTPGPTLYARTGDRLVVHFHNQLDEETTIHWHGLRIDDRMDGTPRVQNPVQPGETFTYDFELPEAGTYWYHPHANTGQQLEKGLQGTIVVVDEDEPVFSAERLIVLDDIRLDNAGEVAFFQNAGPDFMHGRLGDRLLANGSTEPLTGALPKGGIERWRLVNTSNARQMSLSIEGATWRIVGTDGGLLPEAYTADRIQIGVGQRFEIEVRVDGEPGTPVQIVSHVLALDDSDQVIEVPMVVADYVIDGEVVAEEPVYPMITLPEIPALMDVTPIDLGGYAEGNEVTFTINGMHGEELNEEHWTYAQHVPMKFKIKNELGMPHPFHLHGQFFQVLTRNGQPANEPGLKDTVVVFGQDEVEVMTHFENLGEWMFHCHIDSHAEHGMMSHLHVVPAAAMP